MLVNIEAVDAVMEDALRVSRIPGAALAIVSGEETVFAKGYGQRSLEPAAPMTQETAYPIASTTKALNATLIGMLVDDGKLAWDAPVQAYLPGFRLGDPWMSAQVTVRDLLVMRTGLPRHDWLWIENPQLRSELVDRLRYLQLSAGFREKFQYNNLTATTAGYLAEVVTGCDWNDLVRERILGPLAMHTTTFTRPDTNNLTLSYHESSTRNLIRTKLLATEVTGPSGGSIYSTVLDMARWVAFNLAGGKVAGRPLLQAPTLAEIQSPQVCARTDPACPSPNAAYAMGWFVDTYSGRHRIAHGGYIFDVNSSVMLFPQENLGLVSFINFGSPRISRLINEQVSDLLLGSRLAQNVSERIEAYEHSVAENQERLRLLKRVRDTVPSHRLEDYVGPYVHPGYGRVEVRHNDTTLELFRGSLRLPLLHWHYDVWAFAENNLFEIHEAHCFDRASRVMFEVDAEGGIAALNVQLEPAVEPIRFVKGR